MISCFFVIFVHDYNRQATCADNEPACYYNIFLNSQSMNKIAIIAGAGPAGLTAAYELLRRSKGSIRPTVYEQSDQIGGISKTVNHNGNRIDIGGHRFFSKNEEIMQWWRDIAPMQGAPAHDDILLNRNRALAENGPDPEAEDRVMLTRDRVSRIFYLRKFFDYPISLKWRTFANIGLGRTIKAGCGYLKACMHKRKEDSLENFYINRFGKPLYSMFFEDYTEKVWGLHPSKLGADWGSQRVKGLSLSGILKEVLTRPFRSDKSKVETSLIEEFIYPKYGPGQLWECVAADIDTLAGENAVITGQQVTAINIGSDRRVKSVEITDSTGNKSTKPCDYFISSMPIAELLPAIKGIEIPDEVMDTATTLPYRDFITVGLLLDKLQIVNETKLRTYADRVPDTWIYIQERDVKIGRLQVFNNWSPYMVKDFENTVWIGLEYFCSEGDELWEMPQDKFIQMAIDELEHIGIIKADGVLDAVQIKVKKAYPAYYGSYYNLDKVRRFLDSIPNLYCVGRNGQHRYNNMDHSMLTAMAAANNIISDTTAKDNIWAVNTEGEYHESKK